MTVLCGIALLTVNNITWYLIGHYFARRDQRTEHRDS